MAEENQTAAEDNLDRCLHFLGLFCVLRAQTCSVGSKVARCSQTQRGGVLGTVRAVPRVVGNAALPGGRTRDVLHRGGHSEVTCE